MCLSKTFDVTLKTQNQEIQCDIDPVDDLESPSYTNQLRNIKIYNQILERKNKVIKLKPVEQNLNLRARLRRNSLPMRIQTHDILLTNMKDEGGDHQDMHKVISRIETLLLWLSYVLTLIMKYIL